MARTRYTTLATQSILRTQAYSKKPGGSSSNMFLLHLSMLSLLPLLFDSAHGQSAYGYVRDDPKGKKREMHTSSAQSDEPVTSPSSSSSSSTSSPSSSNSQNHAPPPPIIGFSPQAGSSSSSQRLASPSTSYSATPFRTSFTLSQQSSSPPFKPTIPPEQQKARSPSSTSNSPSNPNTTTTHVDDIRASVLLLLDNLLNNPIPSDLSEDSFPSLHDLPIIQACKIVQEMISLDLREGNPALSTIPEEIISVLLCMADTSINATSDLVLNHENLAEHVRLRSILQDIPTSSTESTLVTYNEILRGECFAILEAILKASMAENQTAVRMSMASERSTRDFGAGLLSGEIVDHATQIARQPRNIAYLITAWLLHSLQLESVAKWEGKEGEDSQFNQAMRFKRAIWHMIHRALGVPVLDGEKQIKEYSQAVEAYAAILDYTRKNIPAKQTMYGSLLEALIELPVPPIVSRSRPGIGKEELENATLSTSKHEQLFKASHAFLLEILQEFFHSAQPVKAGSTQKQIFTIVYRDNQWSLETIPHRRQRKEGDSAHGDALISATVQTMSYDIQCLTLLLKYAYRHLNSADIGERFFTQWVEPLLERLRSQLPTAESSHNPLQAETARTPSHDPLNYIVRHQLIDSLRLRGATLLQQNELSQRILDDTIERIAIDAGMSAYTPDEAPRRSTVQERIDFEALAERRRKYWQVDILLRCPDVNNEFISAVLSYWTATGDYHFIRYFMHHFFVMRRQLIDLRPTADKGTLINLYSIEEEETPPLGFEIDYRTAKGRMERMLVSPDLVVSLLNAAEKMGNISLVEKCWLVASEEEEARRQWDLPTAAYTIVLKAYGDEASHERAHAKREAEAASSSGPVPGYSLLRVDSAARSRITPKERAEFQSLGKRACIEFSASIYRRFARKKTLFDADARFFNAALTVFRDDTAKMGPASITRVARDACSEESSWSEGEEQSEEGSDIDSNDSKSDSGFGSDTSLPGQRTPPAAPELLNIIVKDILNSGLELPDWALPYTQSSATGILELKPSEFSVKKSSRQASPLRQWTAPGETVGERKIRKQMAVQWDRGIERRWRKRSRQKRKLRNKDDVPHGIEEEEV